MENEGVKQYCITEVCNMVGVASHVLRYWEKELELDIPRNSLGHRYYLEWHVLLFIRIHELKTAGYQLKAIKTQLEFITAGDSAEGKQEGDEIKPEEMFTYANTAIEEKVMENAVQRLDLEKSSIESQNLEQFKEGIAEAVLAAVRMGNRELNSVLGNRLIKQMDSIMQIQEALQEERFRKLDETIRLYQRERKEIAAKEQKKFKFILR